MNNTHQPKKLAIIYILRILQELSSKEHTLTQAKIAELVKEEYGMSLDRKSIRHNLSKLIEAGYPLRYREEKNTRTGANGIEQTILTDWYYDHEYRFDISELQVMIDSLLFSNCLPPRQCRDLIRKIADLGSKEDRKRLSSSVNTVINRNANRSIFYIISQIGEAITARKQVSFHYCDMDIKFKPVKRCDDNGKVRSYTVSPYKLLSLNGRYYMLCSDDTHDGIAAYRPKTVFYSRFYVVEPVAYDDELAVMLWGNLFEYLIFRDKVILLAAVERIKETTKSKYTSVAL